MAKNDLPVYNNQAPQLSDLAGLRIRPDVLYSDDQGRQKDANRKRVDKLLEQIREPLSRALQPDEAILYVARAQAPITWFEQWTMGAWSYLFTSTVLIFTNRRLFHLATDRNGKWKRSCLRVANWGDLTQSAVAPGLLSSSFTLKFNSGKTIKYWGLRRGDAKALKVLLAAILPASTGDSAAAPDMAPLCPGCLGPLTAGVYQCGKCGMVFKDEKTLTKRAIFVPGGAYFYTGMTGLGILSGLAEVYLFFLGVFVVLSLAGVIPSNDPKDLGAAVFAAIFFVALYAFETWITILHGRRPVRDFMPTSAKGTAESQWRVTSAGK